MELGKKLKLLRQQKNWSQHDVSTRLGISVAAFSKIETDVTDVSISRLIQLADIFGITLGELILTPQQQHLGNTDEVRLLKETIDAHVNKIVELQEYVITLYEEIHQVKRRIL